MKKLFVLLLGFALAFSFWPVGLVKAAGETLITLGTPIVVTGSGASVSGNTVTITAAGTYRVSGTLADGMIAVDTLEAVDLILNGVALTHTSGPAIYVINAAKLNVVLADGSANTLSDGAIYTDTSLKGTIFSNDPLEISGNGALTLTANYKHGIVGDDNLVIAGGNITVVSAIKDAFHANDDISVSGGMIQVTQAGSDSFESEGTLTISGGTLTLAATTDGLKSAGDFTVGGGTIHVTSGAKGIESKSSLIVNDGAITVTVSDDGLSATNALTLNGGQIYVDASGTAMAAGSSMNIAGGVIVALGGSSPDGGLVCSTCQPVINGGTVVATGGTNTIPSNTSTQRVVILGSRPVDTVIQIRQGVTDILVFKVSKAYQSMLFTSPNLAASTSYTVYTGGSVSGGTDFHGLYSGATCSGGSVWATFTTHNIVTYANVLAWVYLPVVANGDSISNTPGETVITLGNSITVTGSGAIVSGSTVTITAAGTYRASGTLSDGAIAVNTTEAVELILNGVTITHTSGPAIYVVAADKLSLVLAEGSTNTLIDGPTYADTSFKGTLFSNDTLEISGTGSLLVTAKYKHGIVSDDDLILSNGNITIVSAVTDGFHANDNITISGGTIKIIQATSDGFESEGTLIVNGGTLNLAVADDGLVGADTLTINAGTILITSGTEGIESKNNVIINDGDITITVSDDGFNATNNVTIHAGQMYVNVSADAVDSNGTLTIDGGVMVVLGGNVPEGALDCDACAISFKGGTVVASGGSNSTPSGASTQRVVVFGSRPVGTVIRVMQGTTDVLTFKVSKAYQSLIFTSPSLAANTTYTVYTGGSVSGGSEFHGLYTGATYTGGTTWATFTTSAVVTYVGGGNPPRP